MSPDGSQLVETPPAPAESTRAAPKTSIRYQRHLRRLEAARKAQRAAVLAANRPAPKEPAATNKTTPKPKRARKVKRSASGAARSLSHAQTASTQPGHFHEHKPRKPTGRPPGAIDLTPRKRRMGDGQEESGLARASGKSRKLYTHKLVFASVPESDWLIINDLASHLGHSPAKWVSQALSEIVAREAAGQAADSLKIGLLRRIRLAWHLACGRIPRKVRRSIAAWDRDLRADRKGRK